ncbi:hypothetical protein EPA93_36750 [Ktedonosporobacter rubrisoli]|uniref:Uncharacterized protein n=1 Tax=Ktedonosporobacter rubrisoli TaxID=2509675 RepID=A0A4P6K0D2_KTERU|nr:hypothetical protein [Ktedonosporobacter rubrisoli]QBD81232.1 hypothetical protein EPA93_36750 [Ktedonosporobacter rubrisoli]
MLLRYMENQDKAGASKNKSWLWAGLFGIPLSIIQYALIFLNDNNLFSSKWVILSFVLYLLAPVLPGLQASLHTQRITMGSRIGLAIGVSSTLLLAIITGLHIWTSGDLPTESLLLPLNVLVLAVISYITLINLVGIIFAVAGGTIGGMIGKRHMHLSP